MKKILLISGKRKSGKDFLCNKLLKKLGEDKCCIVRISAPLKGCYAKVHQLDINELMSDGPYKEQYRLDMIKWSDEIRQKDPGYFCKAACDQSPDKPVWIVSDIRRKTDVNWFTKTFPNSIKLVRIKANLETRIKRGFQFTEGVDDAESECGLDDFNEWDLVLENNDDKQAEDALKSLLELVEKS